MMKAYDRTKDYIFHRRFPFFNVFNAESLGGLMQILHPIQSQAFEIFTQG